MKSIRLEHIDKSFGPAKALIDINLQIQKGELFFLLGPSGCGKSTLLRLIAGLHEPTAGRLFFDEVDVTALGTEQRNAVMCFQSYALWPHLSVRENVRFGLAVRKLPRAEQDEKVNEALSAVQLSDLADRKPNSLSGGQQQRVALARALAVRPDCLLLDEPLSNLDAKLRHEMRGEIRRICKEAKLTTVYVTHDQKEALSIADRIAVMLKGNIVQVGTPGELYRRPRTSFVADFVGQTNLLKGSIIGRVGNAMTIKTAIGIITATTTDDPSIIAAQASSREVIVSIRPEQMRIVEPGAANNEINQFTGDVEQSTFLGESSEHVMNIAGQTIRVIATPPRFDPPARLTVEFNAGDAVVLGE